MPVDTRSLPGIILRGEGGDELASGWCLVTYEAVGQGKPLEEWRGEMTVTSEAYEALGSWGDGLYIRFYPYGGVFEPWHGPVAVEPVDPESDPNRRRIRLRQAGPLTRSRYEPDELRHGFPPKEDEESAERAS
jgi:hypothetical protein